MTRSTQTAAPAFAQAAADVRASLTHHATGGRVSLRDRLADRWFRLSPEERSDLRIALIAGALLLGLALVLGC